jgi:hypothetical protein
MIEKKEKLTLVVLSGDLDKVMLLTLLPLAQPRPAWKWLCSSHFGG